MRKGAIDRRKLTEKQEWYLTGLRAGMSRRQAALAAGYSVSSANNVAYNIERRPRFKLLVDRIRREQALQGNGAKKNQQHPEEVQSDQ